MNLDFLTDYYIPIVVAACLIVGFCFKNIKKLDAISNEYIPTILAVLGAVLGCWTLGGITLPNIVMGAFSGLTSTGLHQLFKTIINNKKTEGDEA